MLLGRLKYWRMIRGYSVRELAAKSGVDASSVSLLENLKRSPHGKTARDLAAALGVEVSDLYPPVTTLKPQQVKLINPIEQNANKTQTIIKAARGKKKATISFWVIEKDRDDDDPFSVATQTEAERLKARLGGQHQARVYQAASKSEARELHRQFLIRVARGHDAW